MRMTLASLLAATLLALAPAAAPAQDAGSQQYQDPLAGDQNDGNGNGNGSGNGSGNAGSGSGAGTAPGTPTQAAQANGQAAQDGLPRTGLDAWLLVIAGTALLGGGFALRRVADRTGA